MDKIKDWKQKTTHVIITIMIQMLFLFQNKVNVSILQSFRALPRKVQFEKYRRVLYNLRNK